LTFIFKSLDPFILRGNMFKASFISMPRPIVPMLIFLSGLKEKSMYIGLRGQENTKNTILIKKRLILMNFS
jgi:hypothetical protein